MEAKFPHQLLFGALLVFLALQALVANSRPVNLESPQVSNDTEWRPYTAGRSCGFRFITVEHQFNDSEGEGRPQIGNYKLYNGRPRWTRAPVTWGIRSDNNLPQGMNSQAVLLAFIGAFNEWQRAVPGFRFTQVSDGDSANIKVAFTSLQGYYGYGWAPYNGKLDMDNSHTSWSTTGNPGPNELDLQSGVLHEIGHTLGLDHSQYNYAVMWWSLNVGTLKRGLSHDDIAAIRDLYP